MGEGPVFPQRGVDIIDAFLAIPKYQALAKGSDDDRRELTAAIVGQLAWEQPNTPWCLKSADPTRPRSKDAIALRLGASLYSWDWQNGSTRQRQVQVGQVAEDITGQNPIFISGVNLLGPAQNPHPVETVPSDARVTALEAQLAQLQARVETLVRFQQEMDNDIARLDDEQNNFGNIVPSIQGSINRIDSYLSSRPIPTGVKVGGALGRYVSVALVTDAK